jgi:LDH2 family malate/lactate/ureidoglycolate dehydrogenase
VLKANPEKIRALVTEIFVRENVPEADAAVIADALLDANLTGRASHGVLRVVAYVDRLEAGGGKAKPDIRVIRESDTTAVIDGDNGLGMVAAKKACMLPGKKRKRAVSPA